MGSYTGSNIVDSAYPDDYTNLVQQLSKMEAQIVELSGLVGGGSQGLAAYPIGSIYWSFDPTDPHDLFGGEWSQIADRFIYAAGSKSVRATAGEEWHKLTITEIPNHKHGLDDHTHGSGTLIAQSNGSHAHHGVSDTSYKVSALQSGKVGRRQFATGSSGYYTWANSASGSSDPLGAYDNTASAGAHEHSVTGSTGGQNKTETKSTGYDGLHNNMPPYIVAYCWERTA